MDQNGASFSGNGVISKDHRLDEIGGIVLGERLFVPGLSPIMVILNRYAPSDTPGDKTSTYFAFDNNEYFLVQQDENDSDRYLLTGNGLGEAAFAAITVFGLIPHPIVLQELLRRRQIYPTANRCPECDEVEIARFWYFPKFSVSPIPGLDHGEACLFRGTCRCVPDIGLSTTHLGAVRNWNEHVNTLESAHDGTIG